MGERVAYLNNGMHRHRHRPHHVERRLLVLRGHVILRDDPLVDHVVRLQMAVARQCRLVRGVRSQTAAQFRCQGQAAVAGHQQLRYASHQQADARQQTRQPIVYLHHIVAVINLKYAQEFLLLSIDLITVLKKYIKNKKLCTSSWKQRVR